MGWLNVGFEEVIQTFDGARYITNKGRAINRRQEPYKRRYSFLAPHGVI